MGIEEGIAFDAKIHGYADINDYIKNLQREASPEKMEKKEVQFKSLQQEHFKLIAELESLIASFHRGENITEKIESIKKLVGYSDD